MNRTTAALVGLLVAGLALVAVALAWGDPGAWGLRVDDPGTVRRQGPLLPGPAWGTAQWWEPRHHLTFGDPATSGRADWPSDYDAAPIVAFDLDGDGGRELIAHSNDTRVHVYNPHSGRLVATLSTTYPSGWYIERILNGVAAGVLAPGEEPTIIVANHAAYVSAWQFQALDSRPDEFRFAQRWEVRMDDFLPNPSMDAKPTLADLDGDGRLDILVQTEEAGLYALRSTDGSAMWKHPWAGGNAAPIAADLDGDGTLEAVFASDTGVVCAFAGATGTTKWCFDATKQGISPASIPVQPTVAELDGQPPMEVLFTVRDAHAGTPDTYDENHLGIFAIRGNANGVVQVVWKRQPDWAHPLSYTQLVVVDVTGDGKPEVLGMDWNTIGHLPGSWENLGPAHLFALDAEGKDLWVRTVDSWWSNKDIAVVDADGDGGLDVLANGAREGSDGVWRFDALTGQPEAFLAVRPWKLERGPLIVDLQGDGKMDLLLPVAPQEGRQDRGAILAYELDAAWNAPWPGYLAALLR